MTKPLPKQSKTLAMAVTLALAGFGASGGQALAEEEAAAPMGAQGDALQEVVVVGSRIKRKDEVSSSPVQTLSEADLRIDGSVTIGETLQSLPSVGSSLNMNGSAGTSHGTSSLNLRNLGENRSLVLVNGHRWVNGAGTRGFRDFVDLNTIPQVIIERVEVLQDGATAIYGADAIAGVVNMHTYDTFEGARVKAYYGISSENDRDTVSGDLLLGKTFGESNWMLALSYSDQKPIYTQDRKISAVPLNGLSTGTTEGLFRETGLAGVPGLPPFTPTVGITRDPGTDGNVIANWRAGNAATDVFNRYYNNYTVAPLTLGSIYLQNKTLIGDSLRFRLEALYNERDSDQLFSAVVPIVQGSRGFIIPNNPAVNPFGILFSGSDFRINNVFDAVGQRDNVQHVETTRVGAGLDGDFANGWSWDSFASWAKNEATFNSVNQINLDKLALGMRACNATGITADVSDLLAGCVPINMFVDMTPAMADYIRFTGHDRNWTEQVDFTLNVTGDLYELPAGALAFAAGYEYREEKGRDIPDSTINSSPRVNTYQTTSSAPRDGTDGKYDLNELYIEFDIPLLRDVPGAQDLSMQAATRYSDYSTFGSTTNSKLGLSWRPVDSLMFRGTWAEGFRAPSIVELYEGYRRTEVPVIDPCSGGGAGLPGCAGVPPGYVQPTPNVPATVGGNPDLQPETSENLSFGLVLTPAALPNASMTLDWYSIKIDDTISSYGAQNLLDLCATTGQRCNFIDRDSNGEVTNVADGPINLNSTKVEGLDLVMRYLASTSVGTWNFMFSASRLLDYTNKSTLPDGSIQVVDKVGTSASREAFPKWRAMFTTQWSQGAWSANYKARYIGDTTETVGGSPRNIPSVTYHDLSGSYAFDNGVMVRLGVDNLFDKQPPSSLTNLNINFDTSTYDPVGRFMYAQVSWDFGG
jgi:outer membrane receptor protein involved in Fe transport